jgi:outer membrane biogenesis lipoprotein LolB
MRRILAATAVSASLLLGACGTAPIPAGTVVGKEIEWSKKKRKVPKISCYEITVKADSDGKEHEGCVTKSQYDEIEVGDKWPTVG